MFFYFHLPSYLCHQPVSKTTFKQRNNFSQLNAQKSSYCTTKSMKLWSLFVLESTYNLHVVFCVNTRMWSKCSGSIVSGRMFIYLKGCDGAKWLCRALYKYEQLLQELRMKIDNIYDLSFLFTNWQPVENNMIPRYGKTKQLINNSVGKECNLDYDTKMIME